MIKNNSNLCITFAGVCFNLHLEKAIEITPHFNNFMRDDGTFTYHVWFHQQKVLPVVTYNLLMHGMEYSIYQDNKGNFYRRFHDHKSDDKPYAVTSYNLAERQVLIEYLPEAGKFFNETGNCFFHIGWEKIMIQESRLVLHASCVDTPYGGILFSGPSGIGKSTQSDLWCKYMNSVMINGDRPILYKKEGRWIASGSPYAGSSRCHVNKTCYVNAVVILRQASECSLRQMKAGEAFLKLYSEMTVNSWDKEFVERVCDLTTNLVTNVPVYELSCTPDYQAVEILKNELLKGGAYNGNGAL